MNKQTDPSSMKISLSHIIVAVCLFKGLTEACQIEGENKKNGKVFYSVLGSTFGKVSKYNLGVVELKNCAQDIQISKTVELPSPQNFSTESWLSETATNERNCRIESEKSPLIKIFKDPSPTASQLIQLSDQCLGLSVQETQSKPIHIGLSKNCQLISKKSESHLFLKGENCRISGVGSLNLKMEWTVLDSCMDLKDKFLDFNLRLRLGALSRQKDNFTQPEMILDKKLEWLFENGLESNPRYKTGRQSYSIHKSDAYEVDFDFLNLSLVGSKYTQLRVKSEFLVQNNSTQKSPFVLSHSLYLVKEGNYQSPLILSRWFTGAYIPPKWMGMDGLSETFNFGPSFESFDLNENALQINAGDLLVLKTELLSPNKGPDRFVEFFNQQLRKYQKKNPSTNSLIDSSDKIDEIKPLGGVDTIKLIPELDQIWSDPAVSPFVLIPLSPILYRKYCLEGQCRSFENIESMPEVRVSFLVEEAEIGLQIKPIEVYKRRFNNEINKAELSQFSRVQCF